jgi:hypothetical protein
MDQPNESQHSHSRSKHSGSHRHRSSHKKSFFSRIISGIRSVFGVGKHKRRSLDRPPFSQRMKYRWEEFKAEFALPERQRRRSQKHMPLKSRLKSRLGEIKSDLTIPRIKYDKLNRPKLGARLKERLEETKDELTFRRLTPKVGKRIPLKAKLAYMRETSWKQYRVIFSKEYMIISFNSLILFLCAFYSVHFLTQLITGIVCHWFDIQTVLYYGTTEYHFTIREVIEGQIIMNKWTLLEIITVFASAPLACLLLGIFIYRLLTMKYLKLGFKKRFRKIRNLFASKLKRQEYKMQHSGDAPTKKIYLSGTLRLFLIWFICHAFTYFFSGMLFSWLFFMRFGYVTGYIFDSYFFDNLAATLSAISMILLGFLFTGLYLHSGRMYFNQLVDWNRMPFAFSQIFIPTILGLTIITLTQLPNIVLKIMALQACMIILVGPLLWRGRKYPEIQFDYKPRTIAIPWKWIISCLIVSAAIIITLKFGIRIN